MVIVLRQVYKIRDFLGPKYVVSSVARVCTRPEMGSPVRLRLNQLMLHNLFAADTTKRGHSCVICDKITVVFDLARSYGIATWK